MVSAPSFADIVVAASEGGVDGLATRGAGQKSVEK